MTTLLEEAFAEAAKLPSPEQDAIAEWLLDELASKRHWTKLFNQSPDFLSRLADAVLFEHRAGRTQRLEPEHL